MEFTLRGLQRIDRLHAGKRPAPGCLCTWPRRKAYSLEVLTASSSASSRLFLLHSPCPLLERCVSSVEKLF